MEFSNRVVVVSGAGSGIGRALALKAASRGAKVAVLDIKGDAAAATVDLITAAGGTARPYAADVTDLDGLKAVAERIEADFGRINVVFNNAGVFTSGPITRTKPEDFAWVFDVNVRGLYNAIQAFIPALERADAAGELAHVVNTGSENSVALPTMGPFTAYTATKHAVLGISDGLRRDLILQGSKIGVSIVCPGLVQTNLWNAKSTRQERFGGAREAPAEAAGSMSDGRTPEATADTVFEGLDAGEFMIITDPRIRSFTDPRLAEIAAALDTTDARVKL
jgi:NAD(P)-dependent dehydrogenase (short-subunit alcohol dehydrogenase family)